MKNVKIVRQTAIHEYNLRVLLNDEQVQIVQRFRETMDWEDQTIESVLETMLRIAIRVEGKEQQDPEILKSRAFVAAQIRADAEKRPK